jgi:hypothetical protein
MEKGDLTYRLHNLISDIIVESGISGISGEGG